MKHQTFGVELETTGLGREKAARIIARILGDGSQVRHPGGAYDKWVAIGPDGRRWAAVTDASVTGHYGDGTDAEVVTPILGGSPEKYAQDMDTLQHIARALREAGARCDESCGLHIHIGRGDQTPKTLRNLVNLVYAHEDFLREALEISDRRWNRWCKPVDEDFLRNLNLKKPDSDAAFARVWYDDDDWEYHARQHYDDSRYHLLNLHSVFQKGTIEFRAFNGTLHAGKIRAYVLLALAITDKALKSKSARPAKNPSPNHAYAFRCWLLNLGFIGDEFAEPRKHLMAAVPGNGAWRHGNDTRRATA